MLRLSRFLMIFLLAALSKAAALAQAPAPTPTPVPGSVSYTHLTLPTIYSV